MFGLIRAIRGKGKGSRPEAIGKWVGGISGAAAGHLLWPKHIVLPSINPVVGWGVCIVGLAVAGRYVGKHVGRQINECMNKNCESAGEGETQTCEAEVITPAS